MSAVWTVGAYRISRVQGEVALHVAQESGTVKLVRPNGQEVYFSWIGRVESLDTNAVFLLDEQQVGGLSYQEARFAENFAHGRLLLAYANTVYLSPHNVPAPPKTQGETLYEAIAHMQIGKPEQDLITTAAETIDRYPGWVNMYEDFWKQTSPYLKFTGYNDDSNCITRAAILVEYLIAAGVPEESITTIAPFAHLYIQVDDPTTDRATFVDFLSSSYRVVPIQTRNGIIVNPAGLPYSIVGLVQQNMLPEFSFPARLGVALVQLRAFGAAEEFLQIQEDIKPLQKRILGSV